DEIGAAAAGEIPARAPERVIAVVVARPSEIGRRPQSAIPPAAVRAALRVDDAAADVVVDRRPREARGCVQDAADRPAANQLLGPGIGVLEDRRGPAR